MDEVLMGKGRDGVGIRQLALSGEIHVEERIVEIECRIVKRRCQHARGVQ